MLKKVVRYFARRNRAIRCLYAGAQNSELLRGAFGVGGNARIKDAINYLGPAGLRGKTVLVVGCNNGLELRNFIRLGSSYAHGVDLIQDIGSEYENDRVKYFRTSVENLDLPDNQYDLVYCMATLEHVPRIELAFPEIVRVTKRSGIIYCLSAPLWNSRNGHHMHEFFYDFPWIHLRLAPDQILAYCHEHNIRDRNDRLKTGRKDGAMDHIIEHIFDQRELNRTWSSEYVRVCQDLEGVQVIENTLGFDWEDHLLTPDIYSELKSKGYTREELLAVSHLFVAKRG